MRSFEDFKLDDVVVIEPFCACACAIIVFCAVNFAIFGLLFNISKMLPIIKNYSSIISSGLASGGWIFSVCASMEVDW